MRPEEGSANSHRATAGAIMGVFPTPGAVLAVAAAAGKELADSSIGRGVIETDWTIQDVESEEKRSHPGLSPAEP